MRWLRRRRQRLGVVDSAIVKALREFHGVGRRFQRYGDIAYARRRLLHPDRRLRPSPGRNARDARCCARRLSNRRRLLLAFQPHRYARTRDCFDDFVKVLQWFDALVLGGFPRVPVVQPIVAADGRALARALRVAGKGRADFRRAVNDLPASHPSTPPAMATW